MNADIYILIQGSTKFKEGRLRGCLDTWLEKFKHYLVSSDGLHEETVNHIIATSLDGWDSCPPKLFKGLAHIVNEPMECKWVFICDDDTFVNNLNLISFCERLDPAAPALYGRDMTGNFPFGHRQLKFLSGGAGTVLSVNTAKKIIDKINKEDWMGWLCHPYVHPPDHTAHKEYPVHAQADNKLGWVAETMGIEMVNFPDLFHPEPSWKHLPISRSITHHRQTSYSAHLSLQKILDEGPPSSI